MAYNLEASIKAKGITLDNYPWKTDLMTDEEISYMLRKDEGEARYEEMHKAHPKMDDRKHVEFMKSW